MWLYFVNTLVFTLFAGIFWIRFLHDFGKNPLPTETVVWLPLAMICGTLAVLNGQRLFTGSFGG